jgi:hypothetical protein
MSAAGKGWVGWVGRCEHSGPPLSRRLHESTHTRTPYTQEWGAARKHVRWDRTAEWGRRPTAAPRWPRGRTQLCPLLRRCWTCTPRRSLRPPRCHSGTAPRHRIAQCSTEQCSTEQCSTRQCSTEQCSTEQCSTEQCSTEQCSTEQCSIGQCMLRAGQNCATKRARQKASAEPTPLRPKATKKEYDYNVELGTKPHPPSPPTHTPKPASRAAGGPAHNRQPKKDAPSC